jgi:transcriptional regulator of heat shock response
MDKAVRKGKVLDIILRSHIDRAEPVGSKYISDILGVSSATVRSIMSELEDEGYLEQPHTSAGRVPTERAYRIYVNALLQERNQIISEIRDIQQEFFAKYRNYLDIIEHTSYALSKLTHYTSFVIYPKDHLYMDGACHIAEQPEFANIGKIKKILKTLDEKEKLLNVVNSYIESGTMKIYIGQENHIEGFKSCTVITASCKVNNKVVGGIGIIGPVRMNYKYVVPAVQHFSETISHLLERIY